MQYELYIDIFLLENFLMNYTILLLMKKILKSNSSSLKISFSAMAVALLTSLVVCGSFSLIIKSCIVHVIGSLIMLKLAFGINRRNCIRHVILLYIVGIFVGGVFSAILQHIGEWEMETILFSGVAIISYLLVTCAIDFLVVSKKTVTEKQTVILQWGDSKVRCTALYDTGNTLVDKLTGNAVNIISSKAIEKFANKRKTLRYIPYSTVQGDNHVMPLIKIDRMYIQGKKEIIIENPYIAISECLDFGSGEYELILHPDCLQEDDNDDKNCS